MEDKGEDDGSSDKMIDPKSKSTDNDEKSTEKKETGAMPDMKHPGTFITETRDNDVLQGRGSGSNLYQGNMVYRDMIDGVATSYTTTSSRKEKNRLVNELIGVIHNMGGRFLHPVEGTECASLGLDPSKDFYFEITDADAVDKVKQAIRYVHYKKRPKLEQRKHGSAGVGGFSPVFGDGGKAGRKMPAKGPAVGGSSGVSTDSATLQMLQGMSTSGLAASGPSGLSMGAASQQAPSSNAPSLQQLQQLLMRQQQGSTVHPLARQNASSFLNNEASNMQQPSQGGVNLNLQNFLRSQQQQQQQQQPQGQQQQPALQHLVGLFQQQQQQKHLGEALDTMRLQLQLNQQQSNQNIGTLLQAMQPTQAQQQGANQQVQLLAALTGGQQAGNLTPSSGPTAPANNNASQAAALQSLLGSPPPASRQLPGVGLTPELQEQIRVALLQQQQQQQQAQQLNPQQQLQLLLLQQQQQDASLNSAAGSGAATQAHGKAAGDGSADGEAASSVTAEEKDGKQGGTKRGQQGSNQSQMKTKRKKN
ncbi:MAG: hypothetical protein SGILL_002234 [Bacillariaceae sp.]